jgi:hypothetical protein
MKEKILKTVLTLLLVGTLFLILSIIFVKYHDEKNHPVYYQQLDSIRINDTVVYPHSEYTYVWIWL